MAVYKRYTRYPELVEKLGLDPNRILDDDTLEVAGTRLHFNEVTVPREVIDGYVKRERKSVRIPAKTLAWWYSRGGA